ncbi:YceH family protein [[Pseudomonas] boreopolis]|uniref:YceH family protein n=1 Tax=Xanthomonas boreopolis TaxID=86183 RepID=UPI0032DCDCA6
MHTDSLPELPVLDAAQARALGCLIEKEATTPDAYPLTVNATHVAANQKTARDPVLALEPGEVHNALRRLEALGLVRQQFSSRAERYEHRLGSALDLTQQQVALLGLLLLRGPQTAGELFARSERLARFNDLDDLRHHLDRLVQRALAVVVPRASGQREDRYMHQLCGAVDVAALAAAAPTTHAGVPGGNDLDARVRVLEDQVAQLQEQLALLQERLQGTV